MSEALPYTITPHILTRIEQIGETLGRAEAADDSQDLLLRRINRIRAIQGSLAIEGNILSQEQVAAILDGNGRMGRLWQTLILTRWKALFAHIPVESLIHASQNDYYNAIRQSSAEGASTPFIAFMLDTILKAMHTPQVTPQVERLLSVLKEEMSQQEIQQALGLKDRKSLRERYLHPALQGGYIEMTHPNTPNAKNQKYRVVVRGMGKR